MHLLTHCREPKPKPSVAFVCRFSSGDCVYHFPFFVVWCVFSTYRYVYIYFYFFFLFLYKYKSIWWLLELFPDAVVITECSLCFGLGMNCRSSVARCVVVVVVVVIFISSRSSLIYIYFSSLFASFGRLVCSLTIFTPLHDANKKNQNHCRESSEEKQTENHAQEEDDEEKEKKYMKKKRRGIKKTHEAASKKPRRKQEVITKANEREKKKSNNNRSSTHNNILKTLIGNVLAAYKTVHTVVRETGE